MKIHCNDGNSDLCESNSLIFIPLEQFILFDDEFRCEYCNSEADESCREALRASIDKMNNYK